MKCDINEMIVSIQAEDELNQDKCVIIGGAPIRDYKRIKDLIPTDAYFVFCDSGFSHNAFLHLRADVLLGDFDSYALPSNTEDSPEMPESTKSCKSPKGSESPAKIIRLPREKDDTDTAFALKYVLELGFREIYLIGAFGALADHSLANLGLLKFARDRGARAVLIDDYSVMEVITGTSRISDSHRYFSLLAIYGTASNVSISNAKYRIKNASVTPENPFAVSNEIIDGDALVCIGEGALLLIQSDQH